MSTGVPAGDRDPYRKETERTGWYGYIAFAGIMMVVLGIFHAMMGLVGTVRGGLLRRRRAAA